MNAIVIKKLTVEEYPVLQTAPDRFAPPANKSIVLGAFDSDKLVGRTCFVEMGHIEGTWVAEEYRKGFTGVRLLKGIENEARDNGFKYALAYAADEKIENYLSRMGYKKHQLTVWGKEL